MKRQSQIFGWIFAGIASALAFFIYFMVRCCSNMTYHQQKFSSKCQKKMEQALEQAFQDYITSTNRVSQRDHYRDAGNFRSLLCSACSKTNSIF